MILLLIMWWNSPHVAIAHLATTLLTEENKKYIVDILSIWESEKISIYEASFWHDNLKKYGVPFMDNWHFRNQPIFKDSYSYDDFPITYNVSSVNNDCISSITNPSTNSLWAISFCFRSLMHFVGDAHCPVHASELYSEKFPTGDKGATNQILVNCTFGSVCKSLHFIWDSGCLDFQEDPFNKAKSDEYWENVSSLWTAYPPEEMFNETASSVDPSIWQNDAYSIAEKYVYGAYPNDSVLTSEYLDSGAAETKKLISVGGYRLGMVFKLFFSARSNNLPNIFKVNGISHLIIIWSINGLLLLIVAIYTYSILKSQSPTNGFVLVEEL